MDFDSWVEGSGFSSTCVISPRMEEVRYPNPHSDAGIFLPSAITWSMWFPKESPNAPAFIFAHPPTVPGIPDMNASSGCSAISDEPGLDALDSVEAFTMSVSVAQSLNHVFVPPPMIVALLDGAELERISRPNVTPPVRKEENSERFSGFRPVV